MSEANNSETSTDGPDWRERQSWAQQQGLGSRTGAAGREFFRALGSDARDGLGRLKNSLPALPRRRPKDQAPAEAIDEPPFSPPPRNRSTFLRLIGRAFAGVAIVMLIVAVGFGGAMFWALHDLPLDAADADVAATEPTILLEAANGDSLGRVGQFKIASVPSEDFSPYLVDAVLAVEDRRFYSHFGVDPRGIARALRRNMEAGEIVEGGSTITQQLVKMLVLDDSRTLTRKVREAFTAIWLETRLSKDEILSRYLNLVYMGANAHGMPAAARLYFDKDVSDLTLSEAAMLAGIIRAPSEYSPLRDLNLAQSRAETVLHAMVESGAIDEAEAEQALAEPATLKRPQMAAEASTWFADWAAEEAAAMAGSFAGSLHVRTTLDSAVQRIAEEAVNRGLSEIGAGKGISQAALVAMRPDGAVVAMVGGRDYEESQFNRAVQAQRQPGSAFKLFVYYAALRNGLRPDDRVEDAPIDVDGWKPENFGDEEYGVVTLGQAFALSINRVAARLALDVGIDEVIRAAHDLGLDAPLGEHPSLALGTEEVSLLDLTSAYAAVAAGSAPVEPWGILALGREDQEQLYSMGPPDVTRRSLGPERDDLIRLLQLTVAEGTGRHAQLPGFAAGKTGTSQNHRDAWFIGFNEALIVGVWVGNDDGSPMDEVTGGSLPALIWKDFVSRATPLVGRGEDAIAAGPADELGGVLYGDMPPGACNYEACATEYRSFRASDCTYQPYDGPRQMCPIQLEGGTPVAAIPQPFGEASLQGASADPFLVPVSEGPSDVPVEAFPEMVAEVAPQIIEEPVSEGPAPAFCDVSACAAAYNSFRASDCTFQPYGGGAREICTKSGISGEGEPLAIAEPPPESEAPVVEAPAPQGPIVLLSDGTPVVLPAEIFGQPAMQNACNVAACAAEYSSFNPADCTFQPLDGGPRQLCTR
jgi:1A family penicillin-binding protein